MSGLIRHVFMGINMSERKNLIQKGLIVPAEARRMSKILKRTVCTAITALNESDIKQPDAIITGTGMGCMENSEKFLIDLSRFGEQCLKPTLFMQSTHNTISSLTAIILKCHGCDVKSYR